MQDMVFQLQLSPKPPHTHTEAHHPGREPASSRACISPLFMLHPALTISICCGWELVNTQCGGDWSFCQLEFSPKMSLGDVKPMPGRRKASSRSGVTFICCWHLKHNMGTQQSTVKSYELRGSVLSETSNHFKSLILDPRAEVIFVTPVTAGGSVKFLPVV